MAKRTPNFIPEECGRCEYFKRTGILDRFKGRCDFYDLLVYSNWKCRGVGDDQEPSGGETNRANTSRRLKGILLISLALIWTLGLLFTYIKLEPIAATYNVTRHETEGRSVGGAAGHLNGRELAQATEFNVRFIESKIAEIERSTSGWEIPTVVLTFRSPAAAVVDGSAVLPFAFVPGIIETMALATGGIILLACSSSHVPCPVCGNLKAKPQGRYFISGKRHPNQCASCGHRWTDGGPPDR